VRAPLLIALLSLVLRGASSKELVLLNGTVRLLAPGSGESATTGARSFQDGEAELSTNGRCGPRAASALDTSICLRALHGVNPAL